MSMVQDEQSEIIGQNSFLDIKSGFDNPQTRTESISVKVGTLI